MERYALILVCVCLAVPGFAQEEDRQRAEFYAAAEHFEQLSKLFRHGIELAAPAVVNIRVTQNRPAGVRTSFSLRQPAEESGTGIVATIAQKQVILTNRHVIGDADPNAIQILTHDRRFLTATDTASNEGFDLAVIEIAEKLPQSARFGDSDKVQAGDVVLAIGNPFDLDRSVSLGIISAVGRRNVPGAAGSVSRIGFFQTDAAVNPGSSGGMLLNLRGEVIGILTAIATQGGRNEGVAFAMPSNAVLRIAEQLVQNGTVVMPYLGFAPKTLTAEERRELGIDRFIGAKIDTITPDSPAERAGLKVNDAILAFNNTEVEDGPHVLHLVAQSDISKPVTLRINRNGELRNITVTPIQQITR